MPEKTLTETEALGLCYATALQSSPSTWGKDQATQANKIAASLFKANRIDDETFARVSGRLGNHSASRQYLEKHSFLAVDDDALSSAIKDAQRAMDKAIDDITNAKP